MPVFLLGALWSIAFLPPARAASGAWNVTTAGNWSTLGNWSPAAVPGTAFGDTATINVNISGSRTVTIDSAVTLGSLSIGDTDASNIYTLALSGGTLTFDQSGNGSGTANLTQLSGSKGDTISAGFSLNDNLAITNSSATGGLLTLSGAIANGGFGAKGLSIRVCLGNNAQALSHMKTQARETIAAKVRWSFS